MVFNLNPHGISYTTGLALALANRLCSSIDTLDRNGINRLGSLDATRLKIWASSCLTPLVSEKKRLHADKKMHYVLEIKLEWQTCVEKSSVNRL